MASKKPVKMSERKKATRATKVMDYQDTVNRGDSKATRTKTVTFSTTPEIVERLDEAVWALRMNRSRVIEAAVLEYLDKNM